MRRTYRIPLYEMKLIVIVAPAIDRTGKVMANAAARQHRAPAPFTDPAGDRVGVSACAWEDFSTGKLYVLVSTKATINEIAHEAYHTAQSVIELTGLPPCSRRMANEQCAYLVGWVAHTIHKTVHGKFSSAHAARQRSVVGSWK